MKSFVYALAALLLLAPIAVNAQDVHYGNSPEQMMSISYPSGHGPFEWVVFVHGGGWTEGSYNVGNKIAPGINAKGYALISVEYRKPPAVTPAQTVGDIAAAIGYLQTNAAKLKLVNGPFTVIGHSAGSHMVGLLASDPAYMKNAGVDSSKAFGFVNLDGVFDIGTDITRDSKGKKTDHQNDLFGKDPAVWASLSPSLIVAKIGPPKAHMCVVHELTVPEYMAQSAEWIAALKKSGADLHETAIPGYTHGQLVQNFSMAGGPILPGVEPCLPPMPAVK